MSKPNLSLEHKVAIVTGAKRGIGKEIALTFAEAGADVAICTSVVKDGQLDAVAKEIHSLGKRALAIQADVSRKADVDRLVKRVIGEFGVIDILVNNAGITGNKCPILECTGGNYDKTMDTDLKGCFLCAQAVGKRMVERKKGIIINISSVAGLRVPLIPGLGVYAVAKAGVIMLTRVLAKELAPYNIRVNAIAPGTVKAPMSITWNNPGEEKRMVDSIPLGRIGQTSDVAAAALFLASDASSFVTGVTFVVDGGQLVHSQ